MAPKKRTVTEAASTPEINRNSRRRSNRISLSSKKSTYFEDNNDSDEELPPRKAVKVSAKESSSRRRKTKANVEDEDDELQYNDDENTSEDEDEDGDAASEEDNSGSEASVPVKPKRGRGKPPKQQTKTTATTKKSNKKARVPERPKTVEKSRGSTKTKKEADSEEDSDDDDDDDENRITFIPAIQLRDTGGVDYEDIRLHKNTFLFLKDLKANNQRSWLKKYDEEYRRSLKDWESFVETLTTRITEADETIPWLPIKDVVFRIYRDIRFSKDQTPYKPHYSAAWSRTGRKGPYACYYVHVEPGRCLVGGGLWHPEADSLARLRASVDERPHRLIRVLMNPAFRKTFLPNAKAGNEKSVVAAFAAHNQTDALKTKPKGFHPDHKYIELLKLRNYTITKQLDESDFLADDAQDKVMGIISAMVEFVTFLNSVVRPDPGADSDSDELGGGTEEHEDGEDGEGEEDEE
ncbi:uncharacterized protein F4812DRAFT_411614 [Daldinia caldariorum]|uniref:uncharacterized protein n=1 Tax=Daldinia caldariorum TaxID=326644 RepID=UPI0020076E9F|nr:uncharacterized protein F4812DRAFT_411614 [Daldinia caldariorum]KAI1473102.1 hypothetical protein F4812DRAFT_411614 [Daldinia caldariorum]